MDIVDLSFVSAYFLWGPYPLFFYAIFFFVISILTTLLYSPVSSQSYDKTLFFPFFFFTYSIVIYFPRQCWYLSCTMMWAGVGWGDGLYERMWWAVNRIILLKINEAWSLNCFDCFLKSPYSIFCMWIHFSINLGRRYFLVWVRWSSPPAYFVVL